MPLYDPQAPTYLDDADARAERDRTFHICSDCRVCVKLCPSFKDLFRFIDDRGGTSEVEQLSAEEHRHVVDECYQCKLCYVICPYTPDQQQEWVIDFPGLMQRSLIVEHEQGEGPGRNAQLLARTDLQGRVGSALAPVLNRSLSLGPARAVMEKVTGISKVRMLPRYARQRFSQWFRRRGRLTTGAPRGEVALFPTCMVEYQEPGIGQALVDVYEHNGFGCTLPEGQVCCGMPWLDAGNREKFVEHARRNVEALSKAVEAGRPIVVPQPTCAYVLKHEVPAHLGTEAARAVAANTFDASEYLMARHRESKLRTDFPGTTYAKIVWHHACHMRAQQIGPKSRDLMALTGAKVQIVEKCSGIDGTWGLRAENVQAAKKVASGLMDAVSRSDAELVAGDCHLANGAIAEDAGKAPLHPMQVLARAYGFASGGGGGDA
ncbi:MAG TPA: heterodisulfide reductase-related iron-sulfur binding cluster [Acidimicrobiia bacterium]|jgi:Fe-S oxidoreductase